MPKMSIVLTDKPETGVNVEVSYDPPITEDSEPSEAQTLGYMLMAYLTFLGNQGLDPDAPV